MISIKGIGSQNNNDNLELQSFIINSSNSQWYFNQHSAAVTDDQGQTKRVLQSILPLRNMIFLSATTAETTDHVAKSEQKKTDSYISTYYTTLKNYDSIIN